MGKNCRQNWMVKMDTTDEVLWMWSWILTTLQKWQYLDNQRLQEDDVSMSWLCQAVRRSVTNYSAKVIVVQTFS
jgi:hypothetical protein